MTPSLRLAVVWLVCLAQPGWLSAANPPRFSPIERTTTGEALLRFDAEAGQPYRLETSTNLSHWDTLMTLRSAGSNQQTDSGAPYRPVRFYRAMEVADPNVVTGDHLQTSAGDVVIHPINHATCVLSWNGLMIYVDPVGGAAAFAGMGPADLVLVTHSHGDHFSSATIDAMRGPTAALAVPQAVYNSLSATLKSLSTVLTNGASTTVAGVEIQAIPAYNLTSNFHPKGAGNGYVLTLGGRRIYFSGDSEDIPEMRALRNIDVAFVCMNLPYTMDVGKAVSAVRAFRPGVVYPYHYRNQDSTFSDLAGFKRQIGTDLGIEVRLRPWY